MSIRFPRALKNAYWIVRHGQSDANVKGTIAGSSPLNVGKNRLTKFGRQQVKRLFVRALSEHPHGDNKWLVYSSPLSRARETAEIIAGVLGASDVTIDDRLIERDFGQYEGRDVSNYNIVWEHDSKELPVSDYGVEELTSVAGRLAKLIGEIEKRNIGYNLVLCTHGDVASVLVAKLTKKRLSQHRSAGALDNGSVYYLRKSTGAHAK